MNIKTLTIVFFTVIGSALGQETTDTLSHLKIVDGAILWQKVYESEDIGEDLVQSFKTSMLPRLNPLGLQGDDSRLTFMLKGDRIAYQKYGESSFSRPLFADHPLDYFVQVDFKANRYRITIKDVKSDGSSSSVRAGLIEHSFGVSELESLVTRKQRTSFKQSREWFLSSLDQHFSEKFDMSKISQDDDQW